MPKSGTFCKIKSRSGKSGYILICDAEEDNPDFIWVWNVVQESSTPDFSRGLVGSSELPTRNHKAPETVRKTRVAKQPDLVTEFRGRLKAAEPAGCGSPRHDADAPQVCILCAGQSRWGVHTPKGGLSHVRSCCRC